MLKVLGIIFLVLIVFLVGMLIWGYLTGSQVQEEFYDALLSGDPDKVLALMHPDVTSKIDKPLLAAYMTFFEERMGELKGLSKSNFSTKTGNGVTTSSGTVEFENGEVKSSLTLKDDKITAFNLESEKLKGYRLEGLADTTLFRERGREFFELAGKGDPGATWNMMHENLQKNAGSLEAFQGVMTRIHGGVGSLTSATYVSEEFKPGESAELTLLYDLQWERGRTKGAIRFQFEALRAHLVGYNFKE